MIGWIKRIFSKKYSVRFRADARVYRTGGGWGDAINVERPLKTDPETNANYGLRVHGWKQKQPRVGDKLYVPYQSGVTRVLIFAKVEPQNDPPDMFFADCYNTELIVHNGEEIEKGETQ